MIIGIIIVIVYDDNRATKQAATAGHSSIVFICLALLVSHLFGARFAQTALKK